MSNRLDPGGPTFCQASSGSKLFGMRIRRLGTGGWGWGQLYENSTEINGLTIEFGGVAPL